MSSLDEKNVNPLEEMTRIANDLLQLSSWGFRESYRSASSEELIYDSEQCRIKLAWGGWDYGTGNTMLILYGRLHASNDSNTMVWKGEECYCWHDFNFALHFLDGRTAREASKLSYSHSLTDPFYEKANEHKYSRRQPEWLAQMHVTIWQHYGQRLFDLFDLRRTDLWQQYQKFLKDVYDVSGRIPEIKPPLDKIC